MISHRNLLANFQQIMADYFLDYGKVAPPNTTTVSWLPFYHDLGLILGICAPILAGVRGVSISPVAFLQRPARWMQLLAGNGRVFSSAPNFAFDLAARKTSDEDMAGLDLGDVLILQNGAERVQPATLRRFTERFARFGLRDKVIRPSYGLAEATVYVATRTPALPPKIVHFDADKLPAGHAVRSRWRRHGAGQLRGAAVADGADRRSRHLHRMSRGNDGGGVGARRQRRVGLLGQAGERASAPSRACSPTPSSGTPEGPWLRTGDLGFLSEGELFIVGRIKDLLILYGRNHAPDDIEATIQEITRSRVAAISVADGHTEKLVTIIELKKRGESDGRGARRTSTHSSRDVASAVFNAHGLSIADLVMVAPGSIPITTSGKVRRAACVEQYRHGQFARLDS